MVLCCRNRLKGDAALTAGRLAIDDDSIGARCPMSSYDSPAYLCNEPQKSLVVTPSSFWRVITGYVPIVHCPNDHLACNVPSAAVRLAIDDDSTGVRRQMSFVPAEHICATNPRSPSLSPRCPSGVS